MHFERAADADPSVRYGFRLRRTSYLNGGMVAVPVDDPTNTAFAIASFSKDAMSIRARGQHRFGEGVKANDLTITRKNGEWFASVTLRVSEDACARARTGDAHRGVDFGLNHWATFDNGETIANPRFVRNEMPRMADLQRQQARKQRGSIRYKRLGKQAAKLHERIGNLRREFVHKTTSRMVTSCAVIATEELKISNMSGSARGTQDKPGRRVKQKAGLNREILSAGLSMAHNLLAYKAVEAGTRMHVSNAPIETVAALRRVLGDRAQDARATHARVHALRTHVTTRPKRSVGHADRCAHAWNGRGGETQTSCAATREVKVCDPRNPRYSVDRRLAAGEFMT
jgi:Probable transposase